jgi:hypothetical protein
MYLSRPGYKHFAAAQAVQRTAGKFVDLPPPFEETNLEGAVVRVPEKGRVCEFVVIAADEQNFRNSYRAGVNSTRSGRRCGGEGGTGYDVQNRILVFRASQLRPACGKLPTI